MFLNSKELGRITVILRSTDYAFRRRFKANVPATEINPRDAGSGTFDAPGVGVPVLKSARLLLVSTPSTVRKIEIELLEPAPAASAVSKPAPEKPAVGAVGAAVAVPYPSRSTTVLVVSRRRILPAVAAALIEDVRLTFGTA